MIIASQCRSGRKYKSSLHFVFKVQAAFVNAHICYFYRCVLYVENNRVVYTDSLSSYDKLDVSGFIHYRINHSKEFADRQNHINGIENF